MDEIIESRTDYTRLLINPFFTSPSVTSQLGQFIITNCLITFCTNYETDEDLTQNNRKPSSQKSSVLLSKAISRTGCSVAPSLHLLVEERTAMLAGSPVLPAQPTARWKPGLAETDKALQHTPGPQGKARHRTPHTPKVKVGTQQ